MRVARGFTLTDSTDPKAASGRMPAKCYQRTSGSTEKGGLMRFVQISDTHLSQDKPHFSDNWAQLAAWIADQHPDLVIHTGDVTFDGAGVEVDLS